MGSNTLTSFADALEKQVGNNEIEMALFTPFLKEKVAPFLIEHQGVELAAILISDMMATGCTSQASFWMIEAGVDDLFTFKKRGEIAVQMIKLYMRRHQRKLEVAYKKPKSATVTKTEKVGFSQWTMAEIDKVVRKAVKESVAEIKYTMRLPGGAHEKDLTSDDLEDFLKSGSEVLQITAQNEQKEFSLYTQLKDALKVCATEVEVLDDIDVKLMFDLYNLEPEDQTRREEIAGELQHAKTTLEKLKPVAPLATQGLEATTRLYIDPVLLASARIVGGVKLYVEKKIAGRMAHGPVDYIFTFENKIICVTEAKYQKLKEGLAQNVAQMAVVREMRGTKRKIDAISGQETSREGDKNASGNEDFEVPVYGIATTAKEWIFSVLVDNTLRISDKIENTNDEQLKFVVALVASLLNAGKLGK